MLGTRPPLQCALRPHSRKVSGFKVSELGLVMLTHRLHSSSFLGLPYRFLYKNHKKELLWSLCLGFKLV